MSSCDQKITEIPQTSMWAVISAAVLIIVCITRWVYSWYNPRCNGKLPPGSMGLPLVGESFQFFAPDTSHDLAPFIKTRMEKYGEIFKTSLVTWPVIVSTDADLNHFIFQQEGNLFQSWYPDTFIEIFGRQNPGSLHGFMHKYLKNMVLHLSGPESLKKMLPEVDQTARRKLQDWSFKDSVEMKNAMESLQERREAPRKEQPDFFDYVLEELQKGETMLTEAIALDLMFVLLFASHETASAGWAVMVCPPAVHLNPEEYKDPLSFNPWRWDGKDLNRASKSFTAFGGGMRFCVGTDFTKVQMAVFLHCPQRNDPS